MARAKRTNRAEARRRHRVAVTDDPSLIEADEGLDEDVAAEPTAGPSATAAPARRTRPAAAAAPRPSLLAAFRGAFRPVNLRSDLTELPTIARRSKAIWLPAVLTVAAAVAWLASPNSITFIFFNYFAYVPPIASIFLAGFLAPRASYLTGFIIGILGAAVFSAVGLVSVTQTLPDGTTTDPAGVANDLLLAWTVSPISGILFGASAGWYRRFLTAANPNRMGPRPPQRPNDRKGRRGSEQRPMLARRR